MCSHVSHMHWLCKESHDLRHRRPERRVFREAHRRDRHRCCRLSGVVLPSQPRVHLFRHPPPRLPQQRSHRRRQPHLLLRVERLRPRDHLQQQYPEAVHVALLRHNPRPQVVRVDVPRRSHRHRAPRLRHRRREPRARRPEVAELRPRGTAEEHVRSLHVAVHHRGVAPLVEVLQRPRHLERRLHPSLPRQRRAPPVELLVEAAFGYVLEHQNPLFLCKIRSRFDRDRERRTTKAMTSHDYEPRSSQ